MIISSFVQRVIIATVLALSATMAFAQTMPGASTVRPSGYQAATGDPGVGRALFNDTTLSTNEMSRASCHVKHRAFSASFAKPYPHQIAMARTQLGLKKVFLDEMVLVCMLMPMAAKPLPWNSKELANLSSYVTELQKSFKPAR